MSAELTASEILEVLASLHRDLAREIVGQCEMDKDRLLARVASDEDSEPAASRDGDTIYRIDRISELRFVEALESLANRDPLRLVMEGLPSEGLVLPKGRPVEEARWCIIVDPIDGTRGLMYQKRPGWILSAVAPDRGPQTSLSDIEAAVQTEIPLVKQHLFDQLKARRGGGAEAVRINRFSGAAERLEFCPSTATTLRHGFAQISRFAPGHRDLLAVIDDELIRKVDGPPVEGKVQVFEDQYLSSAGQLYELMTGRDRFTADLRPLLPPVDVAGTSVRPLTALPYDLCCTLIAEEAGVIVTDEHGGSLDAPLNTKHPVAWIGYANPVLRDLMQEPLQEILRNRGL